MRSVSVANKRAMFSSYYTPVHHESKESKRVLFKYLHYLTESGDKNVQVGVELVNSKFTVLVYIVNAKFESKKIKLDYNQWKNLKVQLPKIISYFKTGEKIESEFDFEISCKQMYDSRTVTIALYDTFVAMKENTWRKLYLLSSVIDEQIDLLQAKDMEINRSYFYLSELIRDILRNDPNLSETQVQEKVCDVARNISTLDMEMLVHLTPELMKE